jgi:hypothetical protein
VKPYPSWTCQPCGLKHGARQKEVSCWHEGTCDVCGKPAAITQVRDFGHFPEWYDDAPRQQKIPKKKKPTRRDD